MLFDGILPKTRLQKTNECKQVKKDEEKSEAYPVTFWGWLPATLHYYVLFKGLKGCDPQPNEPNLWSPTTGDSQVGG